MIGWILVGLLQSSPVVVQLYGKFDSKSQCEEMLQEGLEINPKLKGKLDCWKVEADMLKEVEKEPVTPSKKLPGYKLNGTGMI